MDMPSIFRLALLALAVAFTGNTARADNWDRFHGPNGTGVSNDKNVPVHFGLKNNIRWKVPIAGTGNSSPIVWGNRIFLHTSSPDAKQRSLLCIDTDGNEIWKRSIPAGKATIHPMSSFASSTPTTDGQAVYSSASTAGGRRRFSTRTS
jgi:outer membrane protein assembly factor BamB